jgi:hypothetical protein
MTVLASEIDLTSLELLPIPVIDGNAPPSLPKMVKFTTVPQAIGYLYDLVPTLQAILTSLHHRVTEKTGSFGNRDTGLPALRTELAAIAAVLPSLATREELSASIRRSSQTPDQAGSRGFGTVKCISCGRELPALEGDEASHHRRVAGGRHPLGLLEESRQARTSQRAGIRRHIQTPI